MRVARVRGLEFTYGGAERPALDGVDLDLHAGEVTLVEGPSGGGKSTLLRALAGLVPDYHGGRWRGEVNIEAPPGAGGAAYVFQDPEAQAIFATVERDVAFGPQNTGVPAESIPARVEEALRALDAWHLRRRRIDELSGGERQRVAIASGLAMRPALLLLDEPASQLDPDGVGALAVTLERLAADRGTSVVIAEHRTAALTGIAHRHLRVAGGRITAPEPAEPAAERTQTEAGPVIARLRAVGVGHGGHTVVGPVDIDLPAGTVTVLRGPNGSGKTTLLRALAGLHRPQSGRVELAGRDVTDLGPEGRFPSLCLLPQEPGRYLITESVGAEVGFALERLDMAAAERAARVDALLAAFDLSALADRHPLDLSGGERERVAIAAALAADPVVLALDEPTRGMDPGRRAALVAVLRRHAHRGRSAIVATHDADLAARVADRMVDLGGAVPRPEAVPA